MNGFLMITSFYVKFSSSVYDGHLWYLMFDLCCELALMLMLKSSDYRMKNHTVLLCVFQNM